MMLVSVKMITYKHAPFLKQAIEGILMQEVNFDYELVICDDCSPDETPEIINYFVKNHPNGYRIKYIRHVKNLGMNKNGLFGLQQCTGKYIALCEGDDYWTDPCKLQKQVDFLENNKNYSLCFTQYKSYIQKLDQFETFEYIGLKDFSLIDFQYKKENKIYVSTATCIFRAKILFEVDFEKLLAYMKRIPAGDTFLMSIVLTQGKGIVLDDITTVYRVTGNGESSRFNKYSWSEMRIATLEFLIKEKLVRDDQVLKEIKDRLYQIKLGYYKLRIKSFFSV